MLEIKRHMNVPEGSFFLFGPRGTGKSTFVKSLIDPDTLYVDFLDPETFRIYAAFPETLIKTVNALKPVQVIIDEVQKVPQILEVVHKTMEEKKIRFILTGSSARKLKKTGADMLGGRAVNCRMHPFAAGELGNTFSLDRALHTGLIPVVERSPEPSKTLSAYVDVYLREEIMAEGLVRNLGTFARFLEIISFSHGSVLNISNLARECQTGRGIIAGYLEILEDLLLGYRIQVFTRRAKRKTSAHPKFYFFDNGLYRRLRQRGPLDLESEITGPALEGLIGQHLRASIDFAFPDSRLFFWRSLAGNEVDFILYGDKQFVAIEVKNTSVVRPTDYNGLTSFGDDYPEASLILLYRGSIVMKHKNILVLPVELFLRNPEKYLRSS
ncbi:MAG TPA: AAA family ATPase [Bacteroidales bacterium]|nr:AAA family ATPase [Bacteroidales bacterium]